MTLNVEFTYVHIYKNLNYVKKNTSRASFLLGKHRQLPSGSSLTFWDGIKTLMLLERPLFVLADDRVVAPILVVGTETVGGVGVVESTVEEMLAERAGVELLRLVGASCKRLLSLRSISKSEEFTVNSDEAEQGDVTALLA